MLPRFIIILFASLALTVAAGQQQTGASSQPKKSNKTYIVANNGKQLTKKGLGLFRDVDTEYIRVRRDTIIFMLKEDVLKKLDSDTLNNYVQKSNIETKKISVFQ